MPAARMHRRRAPAATGDRPPIWTFALTAIALFMVSLDRLIVTTALPVIRTHLDAGPEGLEWTVNAYALTFAVLVLTGAALGDRFGRRKLFVAGVAIFTGGSAAAALAPSIGALVAARALQGLGGAILTPLSLTLLSAAIPKRRRGLALGAWGALAGLAAALGPVVGGALSQTLSWQWIFWLNVPLGLLVIALAPTRLVESHGPDDRLDLPGAALASASLLLLVWAPGTRAGPRLGRRPDRRRAGSRNDRARRLRRLGAARARRCCRCACSPIARSRPPTPPRCSRTSAYSARCF